MLVDHLQKTKKEFKNSKKQEIKNYIYKNELYQSLFSTWYKAFNIAKNPKYDGYQRGLGSMVYTFFNKK